MARRSLLRAKFHPHRCNVSSLWGENPQNRPLSQLNGRHFALRAMLLVNYRYLSTSTVSPHPAFYTLPRKLAPQPLSPNFRLTDFPRTPHFTHAPSVAICRRCVYKLFVAYAQRCFIGCVYNKSVAFYTRLCI